MTTSTDQPLTVPAWVPCPNCRAPISPTFPDVFGTYFAQESLVCPLCEAPIDLWEMLVRTARDHFMLTGAFQLLGCTTTIVRTGLLREKVTTVDLLAAGIDPAAEILSINFTASGDLMPLRIHGNVPRHDPKEKRLLVYGASGGHSNGTGSVGIAVTWIVASDDEIPFRSLVAASREYDLGRYDAAVVPANVAVEASLGTAMSEWLHSFSGKKRVKEFLSDAATYSRQLNMLLPIVCHATGMRLMSDSLRGSLNRLRDHRNDVAHRGTPEAPINKNTAAELLTAAVFGFHYARLLHKEILRAQTNGRLPKPRPA